MKTLKMIFFVSICSLLISCSQRYYWAHRTNPQEYGYRDMASCETTANLGSSNSFYSNDEGVNALMQLQSMESKERILNNCMMGKGYYKVNY